MGVDRKEESTCLTSQGRSANCSAEASKATENSTHPGHPLTYFGHHRSPLTGVTCTVLLFRGTFTTEEGCRQSSHRAQESFNTGGHGKSGLIYFEDCDSTPQIPWDGGGVTLRNAAWTQNILLPFYTMLCFIAAPVKIDFINPFHQVNVFSRAFRSSFFIFLLFSLLCFFFFNNSVLYSLNPFFILKLWRLLSSQPHVAGHLAAVMLFLSTMANIFAL